MYACIHAPECPSLIAIGHDFSPRVEEVSPGTVVFDISGLDRLFGPPEQVASSIARRAGPKANVAVAQTPDTAIYAARGIAGVTVIPSGEEPRFLGKLPLEILDPPPEILETLELWGIRTFHDLVALPQDGVAERLGPDGIRLQKSARGACGRPLVPSDSRCVLEETMDLEYPVALMEPLSFILARLLNAVCAELQARSLATNELRLCLKLEDGSEHARTFRLPYPMRDSAAFLKLAQLDLDSHPPKAPVIAVSLAAEPVRPRIIQHGMFLPIAPEPEKLEITLGRIAKLVGERHVGSPELIDTHKPDAFRMIRFAPPPVPTTHNPPPTTHLAIRIFRPALPAKVKLSSDQPKQVVARSMGGEVVSAAGPWRSSGNWWAADAWSRDEWDVALDTGALYRIYFDRQTGGWFVEGSYD